MRVHLFIVSSNYFISLLFWSCSYTSFTNTLIKYTRTVECNPHIGFPIPISIPIKTISLTPASTILVNIKGNNPNSCLGDSNLTLDKFYLALILSICLKGIQLMMSIWAPALIPLVYSASRTRKMWALECKSEAILCSFLYSPVPL